MFIVRILGNPGRIVCNVCKRVSSGEIIEDLSGDGCAYVTKCGAHYYIHTNITLSGDQWRLAETIGRRMLREGIHVKISEDKERDAVLVRINSHYETLKFLRRLCACAIRPIIRDPWRPESFEGTKAKVTPERLKFLFGERAAPLALRKTPASISASRSPISARA